MERTKKERLIIKKLLYYLKVKNEREHILSTLDINLSFKENEALIELIPDIIGFPEDNTLEFDFDYLNNVNAVPHKGKRTDYDNMFCRDWLVDKIYDHMEGEGDFSTDDELINWLYSEYVNLKE